ncbi:hypothetical protein R0L47_07510 [Pectobacterium polonicum]|uniref:hypothetical protein n=1 Tax=Pectobacterium polonicum TaxID=2485124 RepID=UPI00142EA5D2|nr:hypothetical protein [Pectobacterium polonicum]
MIILKKQHGYFLRKMKHRRGEDNRKDDKFPLLIFILKDNPLPRVCENGARG